jgi:hypothetical protein
MTLRTWVIALTAGTLLLSARTGAWGAQYPGWGDTGWVSGQACLNTGGVPSPFAGASQRGTCSAQWMQDENGYVLYRCSGEAAVWCR